MKTQPVFLEKRTKCKILQFSVLLIIYYTPRIVTAGEKHNSVCMDEERSQRGMALLNHTYKSLSEDYPGCLTACMNDPQCKSFNYWWDMLKCDLNNGTKYSAVAKVFIRDISSTYMGLTRQPEINKNVYPSCRHVPPSNGDGEYLIDPTLSGNAFTVYCDMTTDGGGWTAIHMNSLSESNLHFESTSYDITHYRNLSNYNDRRQYLVPSVLVSLQNDMGFDQIRYYCHKKQSGTVFHIMTSMNPFGEAVVKYFLDASLGAVRPEACASYTVLPDDNSTLSSDCSMLGWNGTHADGKWTHYGDNNRNRVMSPMKIFGKRSFASRVKKLSCDDNKGTKKSSLSPGDRWAIFVR